MFSRKSQVKAVSQVKLNLSHPAHISHVFTIIFVVVWRKKKIEIASYTSSAYLQDAPRL